MEKLFMGLMASVVILYVIFLIVKRYVFFEGRFNFDFGWLEFGSKKFWLESLRNKEIKNRLFFTFLVIFIYKALAFFPMPFLASFNWRPQPNNSFVALGLLPYLSACVFVLLFSLVIPPLRKLLFSGDETGLRNVRKITLVVSFFICILQAFLLLYYTDTFYCFVNESVIATPLTLIFGIKIFFLVALVTGYALSLWLAKLITEKGIGQGVAILVAANSFFAFLAVAHKALSSLYAEQSWLTGLFLLVLVGLLLLGCLATIWSSAVPILINGHRQQLFLHLSWLAREPISLAQQVVFLPAIATLFFMGHQIVGSCVNFWLNYTLYAIFVFLFAYLYAFLVFDVKYFAELLGKYRVSFPGVEGFSETIAALRGVRNRQAFLVGLFLFLWLVTCNIILRIYGSLDLSRSVQICLSSLIFIGVFWDILIRMKSLLEMERTGCCATAGIVSDEIEAQIKREYLKEQGIECVIEPLRFTWGLPARTAVNEYYLRINPADCLRARQKLGV